MIPLIHFNLGAAYEKGKRDQEAIREYQKVLELKPDDPDALERLADLHFKAKRFGEAAPLYEKVVKTSPRKAAIYSRLGFAYAELKKHAPVRRELSKGDQARGEGSPHAPEPGAGLQPDGEDEGIDRDV